MNLGAEHRAQAVYPGGRREKQRTKTPRSTLKLDGNLAEGAPLQPASSSALLHLSLSERDAPHGCNTSKS